MIPFSVLDLCPIAIGSTAADALRHSLELAQHAERLGFNTARLRLRSDLFVKPEKEKAQLSLF